MKVLAAQPSNYEDDIQEISQEFTSENTSINSTKLPAIFRLISLPSGTVNIDYGGGKFDNVADYLSQYDVINLVYDPYNRSAEHNRDVIQTVKAAGGADSATCSNVLNVIKEPDVRLNVLKNMAKLVKPGGDIYITVYEGSGRGNEGPTKSGYQLNRKTEDYLDEVKQVFPDAKRKGKLIHATNRSRVQSATATRTNYGGAYDIDPYQYFTTHDILEFGDDVASEASKTTLNKVGTDVRFIDGYIVDYRELVLDFEVAEYLDYISVVVDIDMRKIRHPQDLYKYKSQAVADTVDKAVELMEYDDSVGAATEITAASYWDIPEPSLDPPDPPESIDQYGTCHAHIDAVMLYEDGIATFPEKYNKYNPVLIDPATKQEWEDPETGVTIVDEDLIWDPFFDAFPEDFWDNEPGLYHVVGDLSFDYEITEVYDDWDEDEDGWYHRYDTDYADSYVDNIKLDNLTITPM